MMKRIKEFFVDVWNAAPPVIALLALMALFGIYLLVMWGWILWSALFFARMPS